MYLFYSDSAAADTLHWPLKTAPGISASYCEYRTAHFHAGIDIKTWGALNVPCLAVADGYVSRLKVQSTGYGRALYLTYDSTKVAVYAHLDRFAPIVENLVRERQEATGEFEVDMMFDRASALFFKRGEVVAHSGVTGTEHPHLHFETRVGYDMTYNPLASGFFVQDTKAPTPVAIALTPLDAASTVEGDCQPRLYTRLLRRPDGKWEPGDPIGVSGRIGVSIDAYDQTDNATNELAVYGMDLVVSGETYWSTRYDWFNYADIRQIELERDYRLQRRGRGVYHRLYHIAGNRLPLCSGLGVIDAGTSDEFPVDVKILIYDINGNQSEVCFKLVSDQIEDTARAVGGRPLIWTNGSSRGDQYRIGVDYFDGYLRLTAPPGMNGFRIVGYEDTFTVRLVEGGIAAAWAPPLGVNGNILVKTFDKRGREIGERPLRIVWTLPEIEQTIASEDSLFSVRFLLGSVYDATIVRIEPEPNYEDAGFIELVYRVEPRDQALKNKVEVRFKRSAKEMGESGWGVFYYNERRGWIYLLTRRDSLNLQFISEARSLERFGLVRDTIPPSISTKFSAEMINGRQPLFSAIIKDDLAGISYAGIRVTLDERKVPAEYDQPRARVFYKPPKPLPPGNHTYTIRVEDRVGNVNMQVFKFKIS